MNVNLIKILIYLINKINNQRWAELFFIIYRISNSTIIKLLIFNNNFLLNYLQFIIYSILKKTIYKINKP